VRFLIEFIGGEQNSKISSLIKCSENEAKILRHLSKGYVEGTPQSSAYDVLCAVFGSEEYKFLAGLADVKNLLESGWIVQGFSIFKNQGAEGSGSNLLGLLHSEISLSPLFLKILEEGEFGLTLPSVAPYVDHLDYLKDQFLRVELYGKLSFFSKNVSSDAKSRLEKDVKELEAIIEKRLNLSKISISVEQIFKDNALNDKEQLIFLALLKEEYVGETDANRDLNALVGILSADEFERIKNRALLDEGSKLIENGLIDYDESLNTYGGFSRTFYITDEILQSVMHPKTESKSKKLALETLVKEQEIFELIEPSTDINDVVRIYAQLLELKTDGEIFNIGSGKAYSIEQILQILHRLSGRDIAVQSDAKFIRTNDPALLVCDTAKLLNHGITPCSGDIEALLRLMLASD